MDRLYFVTPLLGARGGLGPYFPMTAVSLPGASLLAWAKRLFCWRSSRWPQRLGRPGGTDTCAAATHEPTNSASPEIHLCAIWPHESKSIYSQANCFIAKTEGVRVKECKILGRPLFFGSNLSFCRGCLICFCYRLFSGQWPFCLSLNYIHTTTNSPCFSRATQSVNLISRPITQNYREQEAGVTLTVKRKGPRTGGVRRLAKAGPC